MAYPTSYSQVDELVHSLHCTATQILMILALQSNTRSRRHNEQYLQHNKRRIKFSDRITSASASGICSLSNTLFCPLPHAFAVSLRTQNPHTYLDCGLITFASCVRTALQAFPPTSFSSFSFPSAPPPYLHVRVGCLFLSITCLNIPKYADRLIHGIMHFPAPVNYISPIQTRISVSCSSKTAILHAELNPLFEPRSTLFPLEQNRLVTTIFVQGIDRRSSPHSNRSYAFSSHALNDAELTDISRHIIGSLHEL